MAGTRSEEDVMLAIGAQHYIPWLEKRKAGKLAELIQAYREGKDLRDKAAEIAVLHDLITTLEAKQRSGNKGER